jgi:hypothetical protein
MESAPLSCRYLLDFIEIIKGFNMEMQTLRKTKGSKQYNLPITSITSSNLHSIAAVLYTSDLPVDKISKYVQEIKNLKYESEGGFTKRIEKKLQSG